MMSPWNRKYEIAHNLWAYLSFRIAHNLWAIWKQLTIKKIHLLHVLQILPRKALGFRYSRFQILTEISIESATIDILGITSHYVSTERPVEA